MNAQEIQNAVVTHEGSDIVISASAGCGKTTTMIRRIAHLVVDKQCGVDELLVVTFTNAAAAEMKEKLARALKEHVEEPGMLDQLVKLESADICTIDSFCSRLVKKYFFAAGVDPDFELLEDADARLALDAAARKVLERRYAAADTGFLVLTDIFAGDRTDRALVETLTELVRLAENHPDRERFLRETLPASCVPGGPAERFLLEDTKSTLLAQAAAFDRLLADPFLNEADAAWCAAAAERIRAVAEQERDFDGWRAVLPALTALPAAPRLSKAKSEESEQAAHARLLEQKADCKKAVEERLLARYYAMSAAELRAGADRVRPSLETLADLAAETVAAFDDAKREVSALDFNDVERAAFHILQTDAVREELRKRYRYVFLDEAQDVNRFQEELLGLLVRGDNAFLVGDVKQCIYRFRGAEPELFSARCRRAEGEPGFFRLSENFRTNADLLAFVNTVFDGCMRADFCSVEYRASERLRGAKQGHIDDGRPAVVANFALREGGERRKAEGVYRVAPDPEAPGSAEGARIAREILALVGGARIVEGESARPVAFADIAVLVRGKKNFSDDVRRALREAGIPVSCEFDYPMFHYAEITVLLDYLRVLDNFRQDIPLAAALAGAFGNFSARELAEIRRCAPDEDCFADCFLRAAGRVPCEERESVPAAPSASAISSSELLTILPAGAVPSSDISAALPAGRGLTDVPAVPSADTARVRRFAPPRPALAEKCRAFLARAERHRQLAALTDAATLIGRIVEDFDYEALLERRGEGCAARFQTFLASVRGKRYAESLPAFLQFAETCADSFRIAEKTGQPDAVLVTTAHKSKGLEYPVVFLAGLDREFNFQDEKKLVVVDGRLGGAMDDYDPAARERTALPLAAAVRRALHYNAVKDELNLLYVAMTRPKYRLYLSGTVREKAFDACTDPRDARCWADFLLPYLYAGGAEVNRIPVSELAPEPLRAEAAAAQGGAEGCEEAFAFVYRGGEQVPVKRTVTELNARFAELAGGSPEERCLFAEPPAEEPEERFSAAGAGERFSAAGGGERAAERFVSAPGESCPSAPCVGPAVDPRARGNAYHKYLELADPNVRTLSDLAADFKRLGACLSEAERALLDPERLLAFFCTVYAPRKPTRILREQPFFLSVPERELGGTSGERVLVQGKIDLLFIYENGFEVVDYKLSRLAEDLLAKTYETQVKIYVSAVERVLKLPNLGAFLYSFGKNRLISIKIGEKDVQNNLFMV